MAEGLARNLFKDKASIQSAGSRPSGVNSYAIKVMTEVGIDISRYRSKSIDNFRNVPFDFVITLCAEEICPVYLGKSHQLHWRFPDPAAVQGSEEEKLAAFRKVRDDLISKLKQFESTLKL